MLHIGGPKDGQDLPFTGLHQDGYTLHYVDHQTIHGIQPPDGRHPYAAPDHWCHRKIKAALHRRSQWA